MSYLVLGSNSFAGSTLVDVLLSKGETVIGVSRSKEPHPALLAYSQNPNIGAFDFYQYDINQHFDQLVELIHAAKPKYIVDFAGQGMVAESWQAPEQWYTTNIVAKVKLHDVLRQCDFLERYVRVSTPEVYGSYDGLMTEALSMNPSTPYAVSHAAIDMSLMAFHRQYDFPVVLTRFANFYGPSQQLYRIIPRTMIYASIGKQLTLHGGGTSERAFIYGTDVAEGILAAMHRGKTGEAYHFTSGECIAIKDLVYKICQTMSIDFDTFATVGPERPGKDARYLMDASKAKRELGWSPQVNLDEGLANTLKWVRENIEMTKETSLEYCHQA